jgi:hypothetical protein
MSRRQKISTPQFIFSYSKQSEAADSSGRAVEVVGLRTLAWWYCVFETR